MTREFYELSKSIANLDEEIAMAAINSSRYPEGYKGDAKNLLLYKDRRFETKTALRERWINWNDRKMCFQMTHCYSRRTLRNVLTFGHFSNSGKKKSEEN